MRRRFAPTGAEVTLSRSDTVATLKHALASEAARLGFDNLKVTAAALDQDASRNFDRFLDGAYFGDMNWLADTADRRRTPTALWADVKSVITLATNYGPHGDPLELLSRPERGAISVYARGRDYHDVVKKRLKALARWLVEETGGDVKVFVDTAPVLEKPLAQAAGLGWQGKHTNLVSRIHGSWVFLGEIFTTLELPPDEPEADHCGACRACLDVCPTAAFIDAYRLDPRRCISYLTIEHKGHIPRDLRPLMGNRIYGCDDCLAVCPWNKFARVHSLPELAPRLELTAPLLTDLVQLSDADFRDVFSGSPIKRIGRDRFIRNVLIALGNGGDKAAVPVITPLCQDQSDVVRVAAAWALGQIDIDAARTIRAEVFDREVDNDVRAEWSAL